MKVHQLKKFADHVMVVYRLKEGDNIREGCSSDKEHFGDLEILKILKTANLLDIAVFVAREYGGVHLGNAHFKIIHEVATKAIQEMQLPNASQNSSDGPVLMSTPQTTPKDKRPPRRGRRNCNRGHSRDDSSQQTLTKTSELPPTPKGQEPAEEQANSDNSESSEDSDAD